MITSELLARLADIDMPSETLRAVLRAVAECEDIATAREEARRARGRERVNRHREKKRAEAVTACNVTETLQSVTPAVSKAQVLEELADFDAIVSVTPALQPVAEAPAKEGVSPDPSTQKTPTPQKTPKGVQKGFALPADWSPSEASRQRARQRGLTDLQIDDEAQGMRDWADANAGRAITKKTNWDAAFDGWIRRKHPMPKAVVADEPFLDVLLKEYPKKDPPRGEARQACLEALAEARTKAKDAEILAGVIGYCREVRSRPKDQQEDRFIPGLRKFLAEEKWVAFQGKAKPAGGEISDTVWDMAVKAYKRNVSTWQRTLGPQPGQPGCRVPLHILERYGYKGSEPPAAMSA